MQIPKGRRKDVPLWDGIAAGDPGDRRRYQPMPGSISALDSLWAQTVAPARLRSAPVGGFNPHKRGRRSNCRTQCYHPTWAPTDTLGTETTEQASWARAGGGGGATVSHRLLPAHCGVHNKKLREGGGGLDGGGGAGVGEGKFSGKLNSLDLPGGRHRSEG